MSSMIHLKHGQVKAYRGKLYADFGEVVLCLSGVYVETIEITSDLDEDALGFEPYCVGLKKCTVTLHANMCEYITGDTGTGKSDWLKTTVPLLELEKMIAEKLKERSAVK